MFLSPDWVGVWVGGWVFGWVGVWAGGVGGGGVGWGWGGAGLALKTFIVLDLDHAYFSHCCDSCYVYPCY